MAGRSAIRIMDGWRITWTGISILNGDFDTSSYCLPL